MCGTEACDEESHYWVQTRFPSDMPKRKVTVLGRTELIDWAGSQLACAEHLAPTVDSLSQFHAHAMRTAGRERYHFTGPRIVVRVRRRNSGRIGRWD